MSLGVICLDPEVEDPGLNDRDADYAEHADERGLTRIIHEASAAAVDPGMSAALRSVGFLDVLSSTPAESSRRAG